MRELLARDIRRSVTQVTAESPLAREVSSLRAALRSALCESEWFHTEAHDLILVDKPSEAWKLRAVPSQEHETCHIQEGEHDDMLRLGDDGRPQMVTDHLKEAVPETFDQIKARYRDSDGLLFQHVISAPNCRYERGFGKGRVPDEVLAMGAEQRMKNILLTRRIDGNPKGYYVNKCKPGIQASDLNAIKSVSFALAKDSEMHRHFDARGSEYGICFHHDFLENRGLRPVVYINETSDGELFQQIFQSPHLVEVFAANYDMRWEREWRIHGALSFDPENVAFLLVPDDAYTSFCDWLDEQMPPESLASEYFVLPASIYSDPVKFVLMAPKLRHWSWQQIRLYGGLIMDFEDFELPIGDDRAAFEASAGEVITCLARAAVQEVYERKHVEWYLTFAGNLSAQTKEGAPFKHLEEIAGNAGEPWRSARELMIDAYEHLFEVQKSRIVQ